MDKRGQYTFYRSFWEAIKVLPKKDRLPIYEAITEYALDGTVPAGLTQSQSAFFSLVKPNLDAARKKAANGKQGGSKPKANGKQNASEKEREKENEIEIEGEKEKEQSASGTDDLLDCFLENYPNKICIGDAVAVWREVAVDRDTAWEITTSLTAWCKSDQWKEKGGRFIPRAAKFLRDGYWRNAPVSAEAESGRQLDGDDIAAIMRMVEEGGAE